MTPSLDIVIVNWNTGPMLAECLHSIAEAHTGVELRRVVVVDNASTDRSLEPAAAAALPLAIVLNADNRGFGAACNQGAAGATADYVLFLNPDTRIRPGTLAHTLAFMESPANRDVGICGIRLVDEEGRTSTAAARFPTLRVLVGESTRLSRLAPAIFPPHLLTARECHTTRDVDQVIGAFFLIRRALFETLGGFDERFFVYYEEVDLSLRAARAGFRSVYFAGAEAIHHGGLSSNQVKAARLFYSLRSRLLYVNKHLPAPSARLVQLITFGVEWPLRMAWAATRGRESVRETIEGYRRLRRFVATTGWRESLDAQRQP
jgi:N-acetylglucosaminyl-diphospho-decaprenol L-rhamnosyltransferase